MNLSPIAYQVLVVGSALLVGISAGGVVGYPSVLLRQIKENDSSIHLDLNYASWMGSIHGLAGIPSILMPNVMQWRGRKFAFIFNCLLISIGWVLTYFATNIVILLVGESFHGLGGHSLAFVIFSCVNEMIDTKLKNVCMHLYTATVILGIVVVSILDRFMYWKTISLAMIAPVVMALLLACFWLESPPWLAYKGKLHECQKAYFCLRGTSEDSKKELDEIIFTQKEILQRDKKKKGDKITLKRFCRNVTRRDFYLPSIHMFVILTMVYWSGFVVLLTYATQMIEKTTKNENAVFIGGVVINSILFVGSLTGNILTKIFNIKPILLLSSGGTAVSLFSVCTVTYLQSVDILPKDSLLCYYCLIAYTIAISVGVASIGFAVAAEIMPVKHRGIGGALYTIYTCILHTSSLKLAPYLFLYINLWGTFIVYMLNAIVCGLYVWKYVPETKNRTLQELENFFMYDQFNRSHVEDDSLSMPIVK